MCLWYHIMLRENLQPSCSGSSFLVFVGWLVGCSLFFSETSVVFRLSRISIFQHNLQIAYKNQSMSMHFNTYLEISPCYQPWKMLATKIKIGHLLTYYGHHHQNSVSQFFHFRCQKWTMFSSIIRSLDYDFINYKLFALSVIFKQIIWVKVIEPLLLVLLVLEQNHNF